MSVRGVLATDGSRRTARYRVPEVVLCAGTLASAQLLLRSGIGAPCPACCAMTGPVVAVDGGQSSTMPEQLPPLVDE